MNLLLALTLALSPLSEPAMLGEILHLLRGLEKRAAVATVTDSLAHRIANPPSVINSIQRGLLQITSATNNTATITSVNTAKTFLSYLGSIPDGNYLAYVELLNATTVKAWRTASDAQTTSVSYEVREFK